MTNFALGGICVTDSIILTLGATIGLTALVAFLKLAIVSLPRFIGNVWRIITLNEDQIAIIRAEMERDKNKQASGISE